MNQAEWCKTLMGAGLEEATASDYGKLLAEADMDMVALGQADKAMLKELGIASLGHQLRILAIAKTEKPAITVKLPVAKPPQLTMDMTPQSFRKFGTDWKVF